MLFDRIPPAGGPPRDVATLLNRIVEYLENLSDYFGFFDVAINEAVSTDGDVWEPLDVTIESADGWEVQNQSEIHATHHQLPGLLNFSIRCVGTSNNRTYDIGIRVDGDDGTIISEPFNTGTTGEINYSVTLFAAGIIQPGSYVEVVLRTDISQVPIVTGSLVFSSTTGAKIPTS